MGNVAIHYKIMPEGADTDLKPIKKELEKMGARKVEEKPVAFGLKALDAIFIIPDSSTSELEEKISKIKGVTSVETESVTLT
jgi:translation elongation factor aEF-1 beta